MPRAGPPASSSPRRRGDEMRAGVRGREELLERGERAFHLRRGGLRRAHREDDFVDADATVDEVVLRTGEIAAEGEEEQVVAGAAEHLVHAEAAIEAVTAGAADQRVVAIRPAQDERGCR